MTLPGPTDDLANLLGPIGREAVDLARWALEGADPARLLGGLSARRNRLERLRDELATRVRSGGPLWRRSAGFGALFALLDDGALGAPALPAVRAAFPALDAAAFAATVPPLPGNIDGARTFVEERNRELERALAAMRRLRRELVGAGSAEAQGEAVDAAEQRGHLRQPGATPGMGRLLRALAGARVYLAGHGRGASDSELWPADPGMAPPFLVLAAAAPCRPFIGWVRDFHEAADLLRAEAGAAEPSPRAVEEPRALTAAELAELVKGGADRVGRVRFTAADLARVLGVSKQSLDRRPGLPAPSGTAARGARFWLVTSELAEHLLAAADADERVRERLSVLMRDQQPPATTDNIGNRP